MAAAEDFAQYQLRFVDDIQHDYEVIRPIVLFAETIAERSRQTGIEATVVGAKARRFAMAGMLGLVDQRLVNPGRKGHVYPEAVAAHILYIKQLYPPIHDREIVQHRAAEIRLYDQSSHRQTLPRALCPPRATGVEPAGLFRVGGRISGALDRRPNVVRRMEQTEYCRLSPDGPVARVCDYGGL